MGMRCDPPTQKAQSTYMDLTGTKGQIDRAKRFHPVTSDCFRCLIKFWRFLKVTPAHFNPHVGGRWAVGWVPTTPRQGPPPQVGCPPPLDKAHHPWCLGVVRPVACRSCAMGI
eukprot:30999-Pelagococcus_subviridis.AAC.5